MTLLLMAAGRGSRRRRGSGLHADAGWRPPPRELSGGGESDRAGPRQRRAAGVGSLGDAPGSLRGRGGARRIVRTVGERLLTEDDLTKVLATKEFRSAFRERLRVFLDAVLHT